MTEEKRCDAATSDLPQSNQATQSSESQQEQQESEPALTTIQIFWTATPEGRVEKDHPVWRAFTGQSQKEMKGFGWLRTIHPDDLERVKREWSGAVERKSALSTEYRLRRADGIYRLFEVHGIPIFKKRGSALREWVGVYVDVTERRQMEEQLRQNQQRTNDALNALLSMAEALVLLPEAAQHAGADDVPLGPTSDPMARYLARLTCKVLDCRGVSLLSMETQTEVLYPIGVAGVTAEYKRSWWMAQEQQKNRLSTSFTAEQIARLQANEVLLFESGQPQSYSLLAPNLTRVALIVPMKVGHQLVGLLILDHGETNYRPGSEEVTLARAVARLAAMVIERKRLMDERARAQAGEIAQREAKQRMEMFLDIASHELKTPLTTMNVNLQVAERVLKPIASAEGGLSGEEVQKKVETAQEMVRSAARQIKLLTRLVSDLIDVSRIQADKLQLHLRRRRCDLAVITQDVVENMRRVFPGRVLRLSISPTSKPLRQASFSVGEDEMMAPVFADPDRVGQVVTNYLTNALRFAPPDTFIKIHLEITKSEASVSVYDDGPGLSVEEQQQVWERFYQGQGADGGLGLGLYISRSIIERQEGEVGVQSEPGGGSTFWFKLPLAPEQDEDEAAGC